MRPLHPRRAVLPPVRRGHDRRGRRAAGCGGTGGRHRRALVPDRAPAVRTPRHRPRPSVCLGTNPFHTPAELLARAEKAFAGFGGTGIDSPFAGTYVPLGYYGKDPRVSALVIEVRRDLYMDEPGGPAEPGLGAPAEAPAELVRSACAEQVLRAAARSHLDAHSWTHRLAALPPPPRGAYSSGRCASGASRRWLGKLERVAASWRIRRNSRCRSYWSRPSAMSCSLVYPITS